jgi:hypothetical protein
MGANAISRTRTQSAADRDARDRRAAVDARALCPLGDGDHPVAVFLGDLIQARARSSHPAGRPGTQAPARRSATACQPGNRTASCCLCTNMWITCAQRRRACAYAVEMLGIPLPGRNHDRAFTWENASRILCMQRRAELSTCHAAIDN